MIPMNMPAEVIEIDIQVLIDQLQPEDLRIFKEYCMIRFPSWLHRLIQREAEARGMPFECFVRFACMQYISQEIAKRNGNVPE